jgi:hypothetical protein
VTLLQTFKRGTGRLVAAVAVIARCASKARRRGREVFRCGRAASAQRRGRGRANRGTRAQRRVEGGGQTLFARAVSRASSVALPAYSRVLSRRALLDRRQFREGGFGLLLQALSCAETLASRSSAPWRRRIVVASPGGSSFSSDAPTSRVYSPSFGRRGAQKLCVAAEGISQLGCGLIRKRHRTVGRAHPRFRLPRTFHPSSSSNATGSTCFERAPASAWRFSARASAENRRVSANATGSRRVALAGHRKSSARQ